jgi:hypothetical protein
MLPTIGLFVWLFYFFVIVSSKQALGTSTTAASPKPRDGPKLQFPRGMQSQVAASASQSTSIASLNPVAIPSVTVIQNATITIQPACSLVTSMLSFCNSISPRFSTFNYVDQTSCLCYPNITAWSPGIFDDAVATCVNLVSATLSEYSRFTSFEGFCTKPGLQATSNSGETQVTSQSIGVITQSIGVPTQSIVTSTTGPTSSPTPTAGSGAPQPIQSNISLEFQNLLSIPTNGSRLDEGRQNRNWGGGKCSFRSRRILVCQFSGRKTLRSSISNALSGQQFVPSALC